jgi:hypothetical protein
MAKARPDRDSRWCPALTGPEWLSPKVHGFGAFASVTLSTRTSSAIARAAFMREFAVASAAHVNRVPKGLDLRDAGAVATTGLTALQGIDTLHLRPGQTVLIFGASGAVGVDGGSIRGSTRGPRHRHRIRRRAGPPRPKARRSSCNRRATCGIHRATQDVRARWTGCGIGARRRPGARAVSRLHAAQGTRCPPERD